MSPQAKEYQEPSEAERHKKRFFLRNFRGEMALPTP